MAIQLHIVTPSRNMLSTVCEDVVLPGFDGEMGVLSEHAHLINKLGAGIVKIHNGGETQKIAIAGGVVEIGSNNVTVLADDAVFEKEVNTAKLEHEQKKVAQDLITLGDESSNREALFENKNGSLLSLIWLKTSF
jgi:F-type H+-transporting ATPase subunit epsilon